MAVAARDGFFDDLKETYKEDGDKCFRGVLL